MAICQQCEGEMMEGISCLSDPITIGSESFEPIRWGDEREAARRAVDFPCRDCQTPIGGVHHPGCCMERCPACLGQALGCPCFAESDEFDETEDEEDDDVDSTDGSDDDLAAHVRVSGTRCRAHLFQRYFRR
jgi:hypothetical protein